MKRFAQNYEENGVTGALNTLCIYTYIYIDVDAACPTKLTHAFGRLKPVLPHKTQKNMPQKQSVSVPWVAASCSWWFLPHCHTSHCWGLPLKEAGVGTTTPMDRPAPRATWTVGERELKGPTRSSVPPWHVPLARRVSFLFAHVRL